MDTKNMITGQLIFRESHDSIHKDPDKQLMMVVGVVAVPKKLNLKGEHKYTIIGNNKPSIESLFTMIDHSMGDVFPDNKEITITLYKESAENLADETIGQTPSGIITSHNKWRV